MAVAKRLKLRLFVEGEEIPVVGAQVSIGMNAPAVASIQVIPLDEAMDLKPRTMVHLFFLDDVTYSTEKDAANSRSDKETTGTYRLLFMGETVGFSYVINSTSRSIVLQCLDFSSYWDAVHTLGIDYGPGGNLFHNFASVIGSDTRLFDNIANQQQTRLLGWLGSRPITDGLKSVSGLAGGIIRTLEAVGGVSNHSKGVNDFFSIAELRCRILSQIAAEENDNTARNLLRNAVFQEWINNGLQNVGGSMTFRDILNLLFRYIYYDFVPNPTSKIDGTRSGSSTTISILNYEEGLAAKKYLEESLRVITTPVTADLYKNKLASTASLIEFAVKSLVKIRERFKQVNHIMLIVNKLNSAKDDLNENLEKSIDLALIKDNAKVIGDAISSLSSRAEAVTAFSIASRIKAHIIRPDCWFVSPPRCNVIFPDWWSSVNYDRNLISECTRGMVSVYNPLVGRDPLISSHVLFPKINKSTAVLTKHASGYGYSQLMQHEKHTGIVPRFEWLTNISSVSRNTKNNAEEIVKARRGWVEKAGLFHFFKYRFSGRQAAVASRFDPFLVCGFPALVITRPYSISSSELSGFPQGLETDLIDKVAKGYTDSPVPTQLIGQVVGISHNIDQGGGATSVSMTHVRKHKGVDDEFLDGFLNRASSKKKRVRYTLTSSAAKKSGTVARILAGVTPQIKSVAVGATGHVPAEVGPHIRTEELTYSIDGSEGAELEQLQQTLTINTYDLAHREVVGETRLVETVLVPATTGTITVGSKNGLTGGRIVSIVVNKPATISNVPVGGSKKTKRMFASVTIVEEVELGVNPVIPFEELVRPGWMSGAYSNYNISKEIYNNFFGCDAITEDLLLTGANKEIIAETSAQTHVDSVTDVDPTDSINSIAEILIKQEDARNLVSAEKATNILAYLYWRVKDRKLDVDSFIRSTKDRPIASISDMLGSDDADISIDSNGRIKSTSGTIGFHTASVNNKLVDSGIGLAGLLEDPNLRFSRINDTGEVTSIPPEYDVRKEKKDKVRNYINKLNKSRAFRG